MTQDAYRRQWLRYHRIYERRAYYLLRRSFIKAVKDINLSLATPNNYEQIIREGFNYKTIQGAYFDLYETIGLLHGKRVLKDIENQTKNLFTDTFRSKVIEFLLSYGGDRIRTISITYLDWIIAEIGSGNLEGNSISQIVTSILKKRSFYRWQLLRIARTETTASAGYASDIASSTTGLVLEKVWISAQDNRTRRIPKDKYDHLNMNGKRVDDGQLFEVPIKTGGFEYLRFPGDPSARAGNVINCRCAMVKVAKRDENGKIIRRF